MKYRIITGIVITVVLIAVYVLFNKSSEQPVEETQTESVQ